MRFTTSITSIEGLLGYQVQNYKLCDKKPGEELVWSRIMNSSGYKHYN